MSEKSINVGFSLEEIKKAGLTVANLRYNKVFVDTRRRTCKEENIALLKKLELKAKPKCVHPEKKEKPAKKESKKEVKEEPKVEEKVEAPAETKPAKKPAKKATKKEE